MILCGTRVKAAVTYLYAGSRVLSAQAAGQGPAAGGDVRHFGNGLHLLRAADAHLKGGREGVRFHGSGGGGL